MKRVIFHSLIGATILLSLAASPAAAAKVKVWQHNDASHFETARFTKTVISDQGVVRLSRELKPLAAVKALHVWDLAEDQNGNLFVATGDEGKLFKISPEGKTSLVYTSPDG